MTRTLRLTPDQFEALKRRAFRALEKQETKAKPKHEPENYARQLARQIAKAKVHDVAPILEYVFDAQLEGGGKGWRFDLCWPELRIAIEVDGAVHRIKERFKADLPKYQAAFGLGYRVLRVSPEQVRNGEALQLVKDIFRR